MKLSEATARALRHRKWHWCRRPNGFSDWPIWRVVATQTNMPLYQVLAFVNRLEEHANAAEQRGRVGDFKAAEFGAALGMTADEAARIFAALEQPEVGWIAYEHIADFIPRNPDRDDDAEAARDRKRRQRTRERGMKEIALRFRRGEIDENRRRALEAELLLDARLSAQLSTAPLSQRDARDALQPVGNFCLAGEFNDLARHAGHNVTPRDIVTVTPEQSRVLSEAAVDNSGDSARGESEGLPREGSAEGEAELAQATSWLEGEGKKLLVERVGWTLLQAEMHLERWRRDLQDDRVLSRIIQGVAAFNFNAATFHIFISDQVVKAVRARGQAQLPLLPTRSIAGTDIVKKGVA